MRAGLRSNSLRSGISDESIGRERIPGYGVIPDHAMKEEDASEVIDDSEAGRIQVGKHPIATRLRFA